jgi:hypothetical protein
VFAIIKIQPLRYGGFALKIFLTVLKGFPMRLSFLLLAALMPTLLLTGCISREQADAKLVAACRAGISALKPDEADAIKAITDVHAGPSSQGPTIRAITMKQAANEDGWITDPVTYSCSFDETFGMFHMGWTAMVRNVNLGDRVIGETGSVIQGDANDFMVLTKAVQGSLDGEPEAILRPAEAHKDPELEAPGDFSGTVDMPSDETGPEVDTDSGPAQ